VKVSSCLDCKTTIIGDRDRCPSCHEQHKINVEIGKAKDRPLSRIVISWFLAVQLIALMVGLAIMAFRSCT
jgi:hypothetical protein